MTNDSPDTIGRNVARYRKLLKLSAADLAEKVGMTRSVIANLENGRKDDVSVSQLMAISKALGVPPVAILTDVHRPNAESAWALPEMDDLQWDFDAHDWKRVEVKPRAVSVFDWFRGVRRPPREECNAAQLDVFGALDAMRSYSSAYQSWISTARTIDKIREEKRAGVASEEDVDYLAFAEDQVVGDAEQVIRMVDVCRNAGVEIENTERELDRVMRKLGFRMPESIDG